MQRDTGSGMVGYWKQTSQKRWYEETEIVKNQLVERLAKSATFDQLYEFLIEQRVRVAIELGQTEKIAVKDILKSRVADLTDTASNEFKIGYTPFLQEYQRSGTFEDYQYFFNDCAPREVLIKGRDELLTSLNCQSLIEITDKLELGDPTRMSVISYKDTAYSRLIEFYDPDTDTKLGSTDYLIIHTMPEQVAVALSRAKELFVKLNDGSARWSDFEKILLMKEMMWHLAHAMPQVRGSAAIHEWLLEGLLKFHGIELDSINTLKFDLIALFTPTPEKFDEKFEINESIERRYHEFISELTSYADNDAVNHFLSIIRHEPSKKLTADEIKILRNGALGVILKKYEDCLPSFFTQAEKEHFPHMVVSDTNHKQKVNNIITERIGAQKQQSGVWAHPVFKTEADYKAWLDEASSFNSRYAMKLDALIYEKSSELWNAEGNVARLKDGVKLFPQLGKLLLCLQNSGLLDQSIFDTLLNYPESLSSISSCVFLMSRVGILNKDNFELLMNNKSNIEKIKKYLSTLYGQKLLTNNNYNLAVILSKREDSDDFFSKQIVLTKAGVNFDLLDKRATHSINFITGLARLSKNSILAVSYYKLLAEHESVAEHLAVVLLSLSKCNLLNEQNISLLPIRSSYFPGISRLLDILSYKGMLSEKNFQSIMNQAERAGAMLSAIVKLNYYHLFTAENFDLLVKNVANADVLVLDIIKLHEAGKFIAESDDSKMSKQYVRFSFESLNLSNVDLSAKKLGGGCFDRTDLSGANLVGADLSHASFKEAKLDGVKILSPSALNNAIELKKTLDSLDRFSLDNQSALAIRRVVLQQLLTEVDNKYLLKIAHDHPYFNRPRDETKEGDEVAVRISNKLSMFFSYVLPNDCQKQLKSKIEQLEANDTPALKK